MYKPAGTFWVAAAGAPLEGSLSILTKDSWFCEMSCKRAGLVCPICCRTAFSSCGFCCITWRICWNCGWFLKNARGSSESDCCSSTPDISAVSLTCNENMGNNFKGVFRCSVSWNYANNWQISNFCFKQIIVDYNYIIFF